MKFFRRLVTQAAVRGQLARYLLAGGVNTVFAFAAFVALEAVLSGYLLALGLAHVLSVLEAFVLARYFVFRVRGVFLRDLLRFWSVYLTAFAANLVALPVLVEILHLPVVPAQAAFLAVSAFVTYAVHRSFSFGREPIATIAEGTPEPSCLLTPPGPRALLKAKENL